MSEKRVAVVPHDSAWKKDFEAEAQRIIDALGEASLAVHHIGSTAIPGIAAKPIIDILLVVRDISRLDMKTAVFQELGYEGKGEFGIPGRRYFRKTNAAGRRTHHVHAFQAGSAHVTRHLAFRDYMSAHPDEARTYGALKERLAREHPYDIQAYMNGKDAYIDEQQRIAIEWAARRQALP